MPLESTDAIVLKSFPYGDTSKIARCYTRDFGKISVIGKGVRKGKTLQGGYLEPLNYLSLFFYHSPKRQLQTFSKAEFQATWLMLKKDVRKISYGFAIAELIDRAVTGEEPHNALFQLIVDIFQAINDTDGNINLLFWYFEIHLLSLMGFRPVLSECPRCHGNLDEGHFLLDYGELVCNRCGRGIDTPVSSRAIEILKCLKQGGIERTAEISLQRGDRKEVGGFLHEYLKYHIEGFRELKSLTVMEKILT